MVYCFTKTTVWQEWLAVQQDVYLKIITIVQANGADFASQARRCTWKMPQHKRLHTKRIRREISRLIYSDQHGSAPRAKNSQVIVA